MNLIIAAACSIACILATGITIAFLTLNNLRKHNINVSDALLGPEELISHAEETARGHNIYKYAHLPKWIISVVNNNYRLILNAYKNNSDSAQYPILISPAAEWLLDNFYIIEEQIKDIIFNLSGKRSSILPMLKDGHMAGCPRVYAIAAELVGHTDGKIDEKSIINFINSYQYRSGLTLSELWALGIMIRIALIEKIQKLCTDMENTRKSWLNAETLSETIAAKINNGEINAENVLIEYLDNCEEIDNSFIEHFIKKLRKSTDNTSMIIDCINARLSEHNLTLDTVSSLEHQIQAARQVSMGNSISSLRLVSTMDWSDIFEQLSQVEKILREDPAGVYPLMDFESRDLYRHLCRKIAHSCKLSENVVAKKAIECASETNVDSNEDLNEDSSRKKHVGYYLTGKGLIKLKEKLGYRCKESKISLTTLKNKNLIIYTGPIALITLIIAGIFTVYAAHASKYRNLWLPLLALIASLVPASELAVDLVNFLTSRIVTPLILPKLELKDGIPDDYATMVIMPTLLPDKKRVKELLQQLEIHYLSNKENNLYFSLVGDFKDTSSQSLPEDEEIIKTALEGIQKLNDKYSADGRTIFYFFHRHRQYCSAQKKWMGWERKRGAIIEFNDLIKGSMNTGFNITSCDISKLPDIMYIITLDADTILPTGSAKRLIGTIAHPLNKAVIDEKKCIVTEGYGLIQPRINISVTSSNASLFAKIFAGQGGIDPYATAISDVYQDLFGEGIFTGKGIYELNTFQKVLKDVIPENSVLSHDLIEGCFVRAGLATDIDLVDGYPSKYSSYAMRSHRWVRGDWQLIPFLFRKITVKNGQKIDNPLSGISKWKIIDNMRRSIINPALLFLILLGFSILPGNSLVWLFFAASVIFIPAINYFLGYMLSENSKLFSSKKSKGASWECKSLILQIVLQFTFIPYQAYLMCDAIIRTLFRVFITKRNMLEWVTAADMENALKNDAKSSLRRMWSTILAGLLLLFLTAINKPAFLGIAFIISAIWCSSYRIAFEISKKHIRKKEPVSPEDILFIRRIARKTYGYFEDMITEDDNFLPPDNFQEKPFNGIAHRTSPTNIGIGLVSIICGYDLGYTGILKLHDKISKIINTIDKMEKWHGHLFNWYDTQSLQILRPAYVSTVDSGNFAGYLIVLAEALKGILNTPAANRNLVLGLIDTINLYNEDIDNNIVKIDTTAIENFASKTFVQSTAALQTAESLPVLDISSWIEILENIRQQLEENDKPSMITHSFYRNKLLDTIKFCLEEIEFFIPSKLMPSLFPNKKTTETYAMQSGRQSESAFSELENAIISCFNKVPIKELTDAYMKLTEFNTGQQDNINGLSKVNIPANAKNIKDIIKSHCEAINEFLSDIKSLIERIYAIVENIEFAPLFESKRQLFSIGYNVDEGKLSKSYYDLFASEARQANYIAIARGEVDKRSWFRLGRKLTVADDSRGLVSWTGTMFEYFMPLLIMKNYENTLWDETYSFVIKAQKHYGKRRSIPWGVSESAYYAFDLALNYQYKAFGVPELGLKRGLGNDMVIAPYATLLALQIDPHSAISNLRELVKEGAEGTYGMYEAVDYTPSRILKNNNRNKDYNVVKSFMVHHEGMGLLAINNFLNNNILQERFHSNPVIKSAELLLQEKIPSKVILSKEHKEKLAVIKKNNSEIGEVIRRYGIPASPLPNVHILSNNSYSVMVTDGGSGYSKADNIAVSRWSSDIMQNHGFYIFIQNINSNNTWSATYAPFNETPEKYNVIFSPDKALFSRKDGNIETRTEVIVSTEDQAEIRRVSITNRSNSSRIIEVTSYIEVVLAHLASDLAHPAFSKLFVTTKYITSPGCLIAGRRPRSHDQRAMWAVHSLIVEGEAIGGVQFETDRMKFIGRNRSLKNPAAMEADTPLSNSQGAVLDPVLCLRRRVKIEPGQTAKLSFILGIGTSEEKALKIIKNYQEPKAVERAFELALTRSTIEYGFLDFKYTDIQLFLEMLPNILYNGTIRRKWAVNIQKNIYGQKELWKFGISGDFPIIVFIISNKDHIDLLKTIIKAHEYFRMKNITVDLVIVLNDEENYMQPLLNAVRETISLSHLRDLQEKNGGVYVLNTSRMSPEELDLIYACAKLIFNDNEGSIKSQLKLGKNDANLIPEKLAAKISPPGNYDASAAFSNISNISDNLKFYNGIGGFSEKGNEYIIILKDGVVTPSPWINIISNGFFGFHVSESGTSYTWSENSRENKLTPWSNDPVSDPQGEIIYLRDDDTGEFWSATPMPIREKQEYVITHGFGYSSFEHLSHDIGQQLVQFTALEKPVKISMISLINHTSTVRNLSLFYYIRPVLGVDDNYTSPFITTEYASYPSAYNDGNASKSSTSGIAPKRTGSVLIYNKYNPDFPDRIAFISSSEEIFSYTGNRQEFIGCNSDARSPEALKRQSLSCTAGAGFDPCASVHIKVTIEAGEKKNLTFLIGQCSNAGDIENIVSKYKNIATCEYELNNVKDFWKNKLGAIHINTPDESMNIILNGWLTYQTIVCRLWARSAFYQAGGAFGFRDQLQDVMALAYTWPELTRKQIILHASHQFIQGDVQHWWHPVSNKGIRTRYSDDYLWLPYVTADYIKSTGDWSILDVEAGFVEDSLLSKNEDERYSVPSIPSAKATIYEHCILSLENVLKFGPHGIPLMGSGDWNDGMNTVGNKGIGESVWLGWFAYTTLKNFIPICNRYNDIERAEKYTLMADNIIKAIEENAWDGSWYKRAYFDDGTPLGSVQNTECKIDSISQSWSVISGAAKPARMIEVMNAVENYLVSREDGIIKLLTPPFDDGSLNPGYIKGYVPGVRENGSQYTHAAIWTILAFAKLGNGNKSHELFNMINPINHARTPMEYQKYKVEPYVIAADILAIHPNTGRGGWTWYTGAAGWMYRVGIEHILGMSRDGMKLVFKPCIPSEWREYTMLYRHGNSTYNIIVKNPNSVNTGISKVILDGKICSDGSIMLTDDGNEHHVEVVM